MGHFRQILDKRVVRLIGGQHQLNFCQNLLQIILTDSTVQGKLFFGKDRFPFAAQHQLTEKR